MADTPTRGERNNNPGNIDRTTPRTPWQGRVDDIALTPGERFEQFLQPKWGVRAIAGTLMAYRDKHGLNTVRGIIDRWAPPSENVTSEYVAHVCGLMSIAAPGMGPDTVLDLDDHTTMLGLVHGIIMHENGRCIYSDALLDEGLRLAGIAAPPPSIIATPVVKAAAATAVAGGVAVQHAASVMSLQQVSTLVDTATPAVSLVQSLSPYVGIALIVAVLIGVIVWRLSLRRDVQA